MKPRDIPKTQAAPTQVEKLKYAPQLNNTILQLVAHTKAKMLAYII